MIVPVVILMQNGGKGGRLTAAPAACEVEQPSILQVIAHVQQRPQRHQTLLPFPPSTPPSTLPYYSWYALPGHIEYSTLVSIDSLPDLIDRGLPGDVLLFEGEGGLLGLGDGVVHGDVGGGELLDLQHDTRAPVLRLHFPHVLQLLPVVLQHVQIVSAHFPHCVL